MFSKQTLILISIIFIITINSIVLIISSKNFSSFQITQSVLVSVVNFLEHQVHRSVFYSKEIVRNYLFLVNVSKENKKLKKELDEKKQEIFLCKEALKKNKRLSKLFTFKNISKLKTEVAEIIGYDPSPWFDTITISKGKKNGVKKNMAVIVRNGIVGKIIEVFPNYSKVLLITDKNSAVSIISQKSRAYGIAVGTGHSCKLEYFLSKYQLKKNDVIITSGLDNVFPKGLKVGYVSKTEKIDEEFFQRVLIKTSVDFNSIEEVLIVF